MRPRYGSRGALSKCGHFFCPRLSQVAEQCVIADKQTDLDRSLGERTGGPRRGVGEGPMIETHYLPDWRWGGGLAHGLAEDWFAATVCYQDQLIVAYVRACTQFASTAAAVATALLGEQPVECEAVKAPALPSTLPRKPHSVAPPIEGPAAQPDPELAAAHQTVLDAVETIISCGHYHPEVFDDGRLLDDRHGGPLEVDGVALGQALHRYAAGCLSTIATLTAIPA